MDFDTIEVSAKSRLKVKISRKEKSSEPFAANVLNGLTAAPKRLSPKFLYDRVGSQLFEQISELPEYYPTRTERTILVDHASRIVESVDETAELVELGSGSSAKTRLLIEAFLAGGRPLHYLPIDISRTMIIKSASVLLDLYPQLQITALVSDYSTALQSLGKRTRRPKLIIFLGSSIGNFEQPDAEAFLRQVRASMASHDRFLIGMDMVKPADILLAAYDDAQGVTARFNLNLLERINRELGGEFDLNAFHHEAIYNEETDCVELYLVSDREQRVPIARLDRTVAFAAGERIHTENSHKYSKEVIEAMAAMNGFQLQNAWYDGNEWFSLNLMRPA